MLLNKTNKQKMYKQKNTNKKRADTHKKIQTTKQTTQ